MTPHPCPCCHELPRVEQDPWRTSYHVVCCVDADGDLDGGFSMSGIVGNGKTRDEAVGDWNQQVEEQ